MPPGYKISTLDFIERSKKTHGNLYDYSKSIYINPKIKIEIICPIHGSIFQFPYHHMRGHKCKYCTNKAKFTSEMFIEKAKKVHGNRYDYSKVKYIDQKHKIKIICPIHGEFEQFPGHHTRGCGCNLCQTSFGIKDTKGFIKKAVQIHGNRYDYSKSVFYNIKTKIEIICKIHGSFKQNATLHLKGQGCNKCNIKKLGQSRILTKKEFIKRATKVHGNKYDYSKFKHTKGTSKICIICPKHGEFQQKTYHHLDGTGCPLCRFSRGEQIIEEYLKNKNIKHIPQYKDPRCRDKKVLSFDFFIPELNTCIEYDGKQHFVEYFVFKNLKKIQLHDSIKNNFCKINKIKLIRIPYWKTKSINRILGQEFKGLK